MIVRVLWGTLLFFIDSFCEIFKPHHTNPPTIKLFFFSMIMNSLYFCACGISEEKKDGKVVVFSC